MGKENEGFIRRFTNAIRSRPTPSEKTVRVFELDEDGYEVEVEPKRFEEDLVINIQPKPLDEVPPLAPEVITATAEEFAFHNPSAVVLDALEDPNKFEASLDKIKNGVPHVLIEGKPDSETGEVVPQITGFREDHGVITEVRLDMPPDLPRE